MRKRLVKTVIFVAVTVGAAIGAAGAAGAVDGVDLDRSVSSTDGNSWT
jgi:hypothetical protein